MGSSLHILEMLTKSLTSRAIRSEELLLKLPEAGTGEGWRMQVPPCFNTSLDLRQTVRIKNKRQELVWTQGSWFAFEKGDTFYDDVRGYEPWQPASFSLCVQIRDARPVSVNDGRRDPGIVNVDLFRPNNGGASVERAGSKCFTQDSFVRFLITGEGI
jgi:hypothetical protein